MAKAILEGEFDADGKPTGHQQRFAVMRYELVKNLQASSKKPRKSGKGVEVVVAKDGKDETLEESLKQKAIAEANLEKVVVPHEEIIKDEPPKTLPGVETVTDDMRAKGLNL